MLGVIIGVISGHCVMSPHAMRIGLEKLPQQMLLRVIEIAEKTVLYLLAP